MSTSDNPSRRTHIMADGRTIHYYGTPSDRPERPHAAVITGGLGFIGQSLAYRLREEGNPVVVLDRRPIASQVEGVEVVRGSVADPEAWEWIRARYRPTAIYHCAGLISVAESVAEPARYFHENVVEAVKMLDQLLLAEPVPLIFSSSAAIYGTPSTVPIPESAAKAPLSPYGVTKWQFEQILDAYQQAYGIPWAALRYFNAAGQLGPVRERHLPETHVLPLMARAIRAGQAPAVFGTDYPTPDGSAIRDYVHVADLVDAHLAAARYLAAGGTSGAFNLGSGAGTSVLELVAAFRRVTGQPVAPTLKDRRPGDSPVLVAAIDRARTLLNWTPVRSTPVDAMVEDAWRASEEGDHA